MKKNDTAAKIGIDTDTRKQKFQIPTYITYIHSFKLETNDNTPAHFSCKIFFPAGGKFKSNFSSIFFFGA